MDNLALIVIILAVSAFAIYRTYIIATGISKLFVYNPSETKRRLRLMKETEARNNERIRKWSENR